MKLANQIQKDLIVFARSSAYDIVLANFYFGSYEMDVFKLNDKMWITEYEIKISKADFKKDFEKSRTHWIKDDKSERGYSSVLTNKHDQMIHGSCNPNRFYFVVPEGLIETKDVPNHCGLIYWNDTGLWIVKNAKLLHKNTQPLKIYKDIARSLSFREIRYRQERNYYQRLFKHERDRVKQCLINMNLKEVAENIFD